METVGKYRPDQLEVMKKTYRDIASKLEGNDWSELAPAWFIPWYELVVGKWSKLGEGSFGSVHRAKWMDSDVVVKRVILAGSTGTVNASTSYSIFSASEDPSATQVQEDTAKRAEARAMFRREVDIWFGFSHPHVVRLFGACHVGRPFFVCEYATNGALVSYLRNNPDELWSKLHEAALGVQYLHARGVVHGDLRGNNIRRPWRPEREQHRGREQREGEGDGLWSQLGRRQRGEYAGVWCVEVGGSGATRYQSSPHFGVGCVPAKRIKISTVVDELAKLTTGSCATTSYQANGLIGTSCSNTVEWEYVPDVIAAARMSLADFQDDVAQPDAVVPLYGSLWERLGQVQKLIGGQHSDACRAAFG
ncbi:hypothetical protein PR001_g24929 [Phytophthora rubi]|uniref:Protein kinase domain-containing protein n=1 Tax=Phytophthora rubi TaxID=129364 RepID=A0A6A3IEA5_9STRA|nr:hypothetical protein PR001_g24929 [Phytophthora rubi]KAE9026005.1 hypothetical protein PR002_g11030 [Phytophthora rubi]